MIDSIGRRAIQRQIEDLNRTDRVVVYLPNYEECTESGCGFDPISRSAKNINCIACNGEGRTVVWSNCYLWGRVAWTDVGRPRFGGTVTTEELGDLTFETRLLHKPLLEDVRDGEGAYLEVDGKHLRVMSVDTNRVEGRTNAVVRCEIVRDD